MVTISHLVGKLIEQKPFIQEALCRGILNNAALAEQLKPLLEKELRKEVKFSAVNMAIRRLAEKLDKKFATRAKFDKESSITLKSHLVEITAFKMEKVQEYIKKLYDVVDIWKGDFLTVTQGINEVMIITNRKHKDAVLGIFPQKMVKKVIENISSLTINMPRTAVNEIGSFYLATKALCWENISIVDIVSTFTEMTILVYENDAARSFNTLKELVEING